MAFLKRKRRRERYKVRDDVVRLTRFERATYRVGVCHSIQLSYKRISILPINYIRSSNLCKGLKFVFCCRPCVSRIFMIG